MAASEDMCYLWREDFKRVMDYTQKGGIIMYQLIYAGKDVKQAITGDVYHDCASEKPCRLFPRLIEQELRALSL